MPPTLTDSAPVPQHMIDFIVENKHEVLDDLATLYEKDLILHHNSVVKYSLADDKHLKNFSSKGNIAEMMCHRKLCAEYSVYSQ